MEIDEIGSEFWSGSTPRLSNGKNDINHMGYQIRYLLSGRTALDLIIKDIVVEKGLFKAYIPSYCCQTMIEPFIKNKIIVNFYDVDYGNEGLLINYDMRNDCEVIFLLDYFGFCSEKINEITEFESKRNKIIILDITQALFCKKNNFKNVDYVFASYRKWFALSVGVAYKKGKFLIPEYTNYNNYYLELRRNAMSLKASYVNGDIKNKGKFLELFSEAEEILSENYLSYTTNDNLINEIATVDINYIRQKRRQNAIILLEQSRTLLPHIITPIFSLIGSNDCPLFVPVIVSNGERDALQKYLIEKNIYCPVHWPLSKLHVGIRERANKIYDNELSLICDQRYETSDMYRIINSIRMYKE